MHEAYHRLRIQEPDPPKAGLL